MAGEDPSEFTLADPAVDRVLQTLRAELALCTPWRTLARPVQVLFPLANTSYEVLHGLGVVPDGMQVLTADAMVRRTPGKQWTSDLAYLQSDVANAFCWVAFGVLREDAFNAQSTS
jgi:hypothetical protein